MKRIKMLKIYCIIFAVCLVVLGVIFLIMADGCKGTEIYGYSGGRVTSHGTIGGNREGYETFMALAIGAFVMGGIGAVSAVALHIMNNAIGKMPIEKSYGKILEKDKYMVSVEFSNGIRKKLAYELDLIVTPGDEGEIEYKDKAGLLVGFANKDR